MLWECNCGCKGIAADLAVCPMCFKERAPESPDAEPEPQPPADPAPDAITKKTTKN